MALDRFGNPYGSSWEGMSMGHGRRVTPETSGGTMFDGCPSSPRADGKHEFTVVACVQSVETYRCDFCGHEEWD